MKYSVPKGKNNGVTVADGVVIARVVFMVVGVSANAEYPPDDWTMFPDISQGTCPECAPQAMCDECGEPAPASYFKFMAHRHVNGREIRIINHRACSEECLDVLCNSVQNTDVGVESTN